MKKLMIGVSGIRGVVGETFTPELITRLGAAFGTYCNGGKVIVARDTRVSGEMVKHALLGGLISTGCRVIDIGVCPTPSLTIMVQELKADGGVMISASHNPIEWNALKFYQGTGIILDEIEGREFLSIYYLGDFDYKAWDGIQDIEYDTTTSQHHLDRIYNTTDVELIRKRAPKVVIDACNGAGSHITPRMLAHMGCEVVELHCTPDGRFPHNPEPVFKNLQDLAGTVKETGADIGFAQDADADRIALVNEKGDIVGEEMSLALATDYVLSAKGAGPVVTNMSTSRVMDDICARHGVDLYRTSVGEVNVSKKMLEVGAAIGGEGNGGVINPAVGTGRDSLAAIALILEGLCSGAEILSEIVAGFPEYRIVKEVVSCPRGAVARILKGLEEHYADNGAINTDDGLKVIWEKAWVHIRRSATEPVVRVISEAPSLDEATKINRDVQAFMQDMIGEEQNGEQ